MSIPVVFRVNGIDFSDLVAYDGYTLTKEGLQADGSGRNPLDGEMRFVTVKVPRYLNVTIVNDAPQARVAELSRIMWSNGQVNRYTFWSTHDNREITITGYLNVESHSLFSIYRDIQNRTQVMLKSYPIQITEM